MKSRPLHRFMVAPALLVAFAAFAACDGALPNVTADAAADGEPVDSGPPRARFTVPSTLAALDGEHFFDHPWPSDLRREADGTVRLLGYINPREAPLIKKYIAQMTGRLDGFSPAAAGYLAFSTKIDLASLPIDAKGSLAPSSALQLIDVDETSPELGARRAIVWKFRDRVGDYYTLQNTLSWMPVIGLPLRPKTRYAIVATHALRSEGGRAFIANDELQTVLDGQGKLGTSWAASIAALSKAGIGKSDIAHLSIFTTSDPTAEMLKVAAHARSLPPPKVSTVAALESAAAFDRYEGKYDGSPDYQQGTVPFQTDGGNFVLDAAGVPVKQRDFSLRFSLAVPKTAKCPAPAGGYPLVLYAHGTGGDYNSFIYDKTADALAVKCVASMGIDQIFHGTRPGAPPEGIDARDSKIELLFFNVGNGLAARTNPRQATVDEVARARLVTTGGLVIPAAVSKTGAEIKFDPKRLGFFGHSQGGLNGPLLFAVDDQTRGGVLSGAGSAIEFSLLLKTAPEPSVAGVVHAFLGVQPENEDEISEFHPAISLVQTLIDPADPVHYYGAITRAPFAGHVAKSVLMTEGVNPDGTGDSFAPPRTIEAGAIAARYPIVSPVVRDIPELTGLSGVSPAGLPITGNMAAGKATGGIAQFPPAVGFDGHFVVFHVPAAREMASAFCASLLGDGVAVIGTP